MEERELTQEIKPPANTKGAARWLKDNLFNTWYNVFLTCLALVLLFFAFKGLLTWAFTEAEWDVIPANFRLFMVGSYPQEQIWRVWNAIYILSVLIGLSAGLWGGLVRRFAVVLSGVWFISALLPFEFSTRGWLLGAIAMIAVSFFLGRGRTGLRPWILGAWILSFPVIMVVLRGFGENGVLTSNWGGLLLTLILAVVGIVVSFPLGVFLALCRQSNLPAIRWVSTTYIETVRGVPLITILFMGNVLIPIFMPGLDINQVLRMMIGITLFSAAYMAENVRGGLQGVPRGQHEAAQAVGLNYVQTTLFIVLPQALRSVIPAIVGQFIALFKDTSLVAIIGLIDLLGVSKSVIANLDWLGLQAEVYLFAAVIYFVFCYAISYASQDIETDLGVGKH
ncbi:MAG: amino acid ABC transporter permease [Candidatus Poribacteria bacterium]|nr:amino acid ABC transporter permease [Candidatus Poribacteria bacterium]MDE0324480.1 amino acid ABC transporter permease [Candidatus Poribacteria bacterium]